MPARADQSLFCRLATGSTVASGAPARRGGCSGMAAGSLAAPSGAKPAARTSSGAASSSGRAQIRRSCSHRPKLGIAVTQEEGELAGSLWITGGIPVKRSDGEPFETRPRMTLCRCGHSKMKPLCDGTHREIDFRERSEAAAEAALA